MEEYLIKQIHNGWILQGPNKTSKGDYVSSIAIELFLPTIHAVADVLTTWQAVGFIKATSRARDKWNFK